MATVRATFTPATEWRRLPPLRELTMSNCNTPPIVRGRLTEAELDRSISGRRAITICADSEGDPGYREAMASGRRARCCNGNCYQGRACDCVPNVETREDEAADDAAFVRRMRRIDERVRALLWVVVSVLIACATPWALHYFGRI